MPATRPETTLKSALYDAHERGLEALERRRRLRTLTPRAGLDFASNDYLGLAGSNELKKATADAIARGVSIGATGSRLLRGNDEEHEALEAEAADHFGAPSALFFGGGFIANYAVFSTLPQRGDLIVHDELVHASVHDGVRASRSDATSTKHNSPQAIEDAISGWRNKGGHGTIWIAVESLYSMDGDKAPLDDLMMIADRHGAVLVIDEAHATGVFGRKGAGLASHLSARDNVLSLHTCGKALGVMGAVVCMPQVLRQFLINRCRSFIYATAPSPLIAATVREALKIVSSDTVRRPQLHKLMAVAAAELSGALQIEPAGAQIQPVIVGSDERALRIAGRMQARGFDIRAIRPPTVPQGTARLRIAITRNVDTAAIKAMASALAEELAASQK